MHVKNNEREASCRRWYFRTCVAGFFALPVEETFLRFPLPVGVERGLVAFLVGVAPVLDISRGVVYTKANRTIGIRNFGSSTHVKESSSSDMNSRK